MGGEIVRIDISKGAKHTVSTDLFCTFMYMYMIVYTCVYVCVSTDLLSTFMYMYVHICVRTG